MNLDSVYTCKCHLRMLKIFAFLYARYKTLRLKVTVLNRHIKLGINVHVKVKFLFFLRIEIENITSIPKDEDSVEGLL